MVCKVAIVMRFGAVESPARPQDMAGIISEMIREGVLGLARQGDPVHEEQDARDYAGLETGA